MSASLDDVSVGLVDEYCILCNVWLGGGAAQHTRGAKHLKCSEAAAAVFRRTAPAACVLVASLLRREVAAAVFRRTCGQCGEDVGPTFRQAVQHLDSRHHRRRSERGTCAPAVIAAGEQLHLASLVRDVFCCVCNCVVPAQQEKHVISKRHQRNVHMSMASASLMEAAERWRETWVELLKPLHGNICCCCAEYVAVEDIAHHFASKNHKTSHALSRSPKGREATLRLRSLLERAHEYTSGGFCPVCDMMLKPSTVMHHVRGKRHNMELLREDRDSEGYIKIWMERFNTAREKHHEEEKRQQQQQLCLVSGAKKNLTKKKTPSFQPDTLEANNGIVVVKSEECVDQPGQSSSCSSSSIVDTPLIFFVLKGSCLLCDCTLAPQTTSLVGTAVCKEHQRSPIHKEAVGKFVSQQRESGFMDATIAWAAYWYETVFGSLREGDVAWRECAGRFGLYSRDDFVKLLQDDQLADAFTEAVWTLRPASS